MVSNIGKSDCICPDSKCTLNVNKNSGDSSDGWVDVLENLTVFLSASADLVKDLKQTVQSTEKDSEKMEALKPENNTEKTPEKNIQGKENCICATSCSGAQKKSGDEIVTVISTKTTEETPPKLKGIGDVEPLSTKCVKNVGDLKDNTVSTNTIVLEPHYETCEEDHIADTQEIKSKSILSESKRQSKSSVGKTQASKKLLLEQFIKEKTERLTKLKETVTITQKNLSDIQEQIRQLERLFQDYTSMNTPEGQVNPAALYKQIMKPQSVPFIKPLSQAKVPPENLTECGCQESSFITPNLSVKQNSKINKSSQEKVSVLSAVPFDQVFI